MIETKILINGKSIKDHVAETKRSIAAGMKSNPKLRNVILTYMSDFIVERSKLLSKTAKITSPIDPNANRAAPDAQFDIGKLGKALDIDLTQLGTEGTSTIDIKQSIGTGSYLTTLTSFTLQPGEKSAFEQEYGLTATKKEGENRLTYLGAKIVEISSDELKQVIKRLGLESVILSRIETKFQNLLYVDYLDKRHNSKPRVTLTINPLKLLSITSIDSPYIIVQARPTSSSLKSISIELSIKLSESGEQLVINQSIDITEKFHRELGSLFSKRFINYAIERAQKSKYFNELIFEIISLANEFAEGSHTPIEYLSVIKKNTQNPYRQKLNFIDNKTQYIDKSKQKQAFISNIQWTMLTQKRLGETMKRIGNPEPPNIKERSGRFRASVEVTANYRANLISYVYNPLYRGLEHYGYHPEVQIESAIREVAQRLYNRHFSIVRKGSLA